MTKPQEFRYFTLWRSACNAQGWSPSDNAKRHEIHVKTLGYDTSHKFMNNREVDRIFVELTLLADDTNLNAAIACVNPDIQERKRLIWRIKSLAKEGYYRSICVDSYKTTQLEDLSITQLTQLRNTISNRMRKKRHKNAAVVNSSDIVPNENCPF